MNTKKLGAGVRCYVAKYGGKPIAFIAVANVHMKVQYYRVSRLVVLPDYQGIGVGKRLLDFMADLYTRQTKRPFYIVTSNPQLARGLSNWKVKRFGHGSFGRGNTRINRGLVKANSRGRLTVTLRYVLNMGAPKP
ncbi:MAG: GNAT family N-acetyltransferase [Candidatus Bathyarchaeota archaeon]|nr:GNAT family N-acetyltransferase [Candidatus Bathyarchaeota archaeon]